MPSATKLMPFFGLREFTAVAWKENQATVLTDAVTLLRAVAKVEVVVVNDSGDARARVKVVTNFDGWTIDESSIPLAYIRI